MLQHHLGFVLKPVQPPPRGDREVDFYRKISSSNHKDDVSFRQMTPRFHGVENIVKEDGSKSQYLVLGKLINIKGGVWAKALFLVNTSRRGKVGVQIATKLLTLILSTPRRSERKPGR